MTSTRTSDLNQRSASRRAGVNLGVTLSACLVAGATVFLPIAGPAQTSRVAPTALPAPVVRVSVSRAAAGTGDRLVLLVRVVAEGVRLGSYQGILRFDPAALIIDSSMAGKDGSRFVNAVDAARGLVKFAGFTTSGFVSDEAVRIVAHGSGAQPFARLAAHLEAAGDLEGKSLPKTALISAAGLSARP